MCVCVIAYVCVMSCVMFCVMCHVMQCNELHFFVFDMVDVFFVDVWHMECLDWEWG